MVPNIEMPDLASLEKDFTYEFGEITEDEEGRSSVRIKITFDQEISYHKFVLRKINNNWFIEAYDQEYY